MGRKIKMVFKAKNENRLFKQVRLNKDNKNKVKEIAENYGLSPDEYIHVVLLKEIDKY